MPKTGPSQPEWARRLKLFAHGKFTFRRGEVPKQGSWQYKEMTKIKNCPKHNALISQHQQTFFGGTVQCNCGYHDVCLI